MFPYFRYFIVTTFLLGCVSIQASEQAPSSNQLAIYAAERFLLAQLNGHNWRFVDAHLRIVLPAALYKDLKDQFRLLHCCYTSVPVLRYDVPVAAAAAVPSDNRSTVSDTNDHMLCIGYLPSYKQLLEDASLLIAQTQGEEGYRNFLQHKYRVQLYYATVAARVRSTYSANPPLPK